MKTIFISYVFEDNASLAAVRNWQKQGLSQNVTFITEDKDLRHEGSSVVESYLKSLITKADAIAILVGNDTHNHHWIAWEYNYAQNNKLKYEVFRIPNTSGAAPKIVGREPLKLTLANLQNTIERWGW